MTTWTGVSCSGIKIRTKIKLQVIGIRVYGGLGLRTKCLNNKTDLVTLTKVVMTIIMLSI